MPTGLDDSDHLDFAAMLAKAKDSNADATEVLGIVVAAVRATGRKGSMTLTVSFEERDSSSHELGVTFKAAARPPQVNTLHSFYSHEGGGVAKAPESHLFTGYDAERESGAGEGPDIPEHGSGPEGEW